MITEQNQRVFIWKNQIFCFHLLTDYFRHEIIIITVYWRMRDFTLFGRVVIIKSLGISQLIYSASNVDVPNHVISTAKKRLFSFCGRTKRVGLYQNYDKGGLRMPDLECMIKALRMAWIPRLPKEGHQNWKTVPDHFFKRYGGLRINFEL